MYFFPHDTAAPVPRIMRCALCLHRCFNPIYIHFYCRNLTLQSLCREVFSSSYSEQISQFILPALAYGRDPFPFVDLLHALLPVFEHSQANSEENRMDLVSAKQNGTVSCDWILSVDPTLWLLGAVLHLGQNHVGKENV